MQHGEERFHRRIVPSGSDSAHRADQPETLERLLRCSGPEVRASVGAHRAASCSLWPAARWAGLCAVYADSFDRVRKMLLLRVQAPHTRFRSAVAGSNEFINDEPIAELLVICVDLLSGIEQVRFIPVPG